MYIIRTLAPAAGFVWQQVCAAAASCRTGVCGQREAQMDVYTYIYNHLLLRGYSI